MEDEHFTEIKANGLDREAEPGGEEIFVGVSGVDDEVEGLRGRLMDGLEGKDFGKGLVEADV